MNCKVEIRVNNSRKHNITLSLSVTTNVKVYEISTPKYLHIVLSIYFSVYNLTMAT